MVTVNREESVDWNKEYDEAGRRSTRSSKGGFSKGFDVTFSVNRQRWSNISQRELEEF